MDGITLISPVVLVMRPDLALSARSGVDRAEKRIFGEVSMLRSNAERRDFWAGLSEYVAVNVANIDGKLAGADVAAAAVADGG